jgi:hypothetical protein
MSTIAELVEQLKEGAISKDQMLECIYSSSFLGKTEHTVATPQNRVETGLSSSIEESEIEFTYNTFDSKHGLEPIPDFSTAEVVTHEFLERQNQWEMRKSFNNEVLKLQQKKEEGKECTFQPKINSGKPRSPNETLGRLTVVKDNRRVLWLKEEQERKKIEEETKECTFQPEINKNSTVFGSRYLSETPKTRNSIPQQRFAPRIKGPGKHMHAAKEYLRQDPFERLSRPKEAYQPEPEEFQASYKSISPVSQFTGCTFSSKPFYERQALYEMMKQSKREAVDQSKTAQPKINDKSRRMVKNSFADRNEEVIRKKNEKVKEKDENSFKPKITSMGKMLRNRSFAEMSYGDSKKRNEKIEYLKGVIEDKEREIMSPFFVPNKSYTSVKSKLQILEDPENYIERLKSQQRKKEFESQIAKEEKVRMEISECTYQPTIIDAPEYVKQIARNMAMIRAETKNNVRPVKPEWR